MVGLVDGMFSPVSSGLILAQIIQRKKFRPMHPWLAVDILLEYSWNINTGAEQLGYHCLYDYAARNNFTCRTREPVLALVLVLTLPV